MNNVKEWVSGEVAAKNYLIKEEFIIVEENYSNQLGEIDIIAIDPVSRQVKKLKEQLNAGEINQLVYNRFVKMAENILVFVEVKTRSTKAFGDALFAVDRNKQRKICQVANAYLKANGKTKVPSRFDCIGITGEKITHVENAFENIYG